ncbi:M48 family metallopeptidase [Shewanella indica]|uniref:M48 family metallopeptidase n=1 Tax=Shewanella indica TaxID=768528 RepID=UPI00313E4842
MNNRIFGLLAILFVGALSGCSTTQSPTGRSQMLLFSPEQINQMGTASFEQIKAKEKQSQDKAARAYVACVAQRITSLLPQQHWQWVLFESDQVNAFALPGGHIGVYTGLLKVANNEDQLATVIGHEIAHVLAQHGNEQASRAQLSNTGMQLAGTALGMGQVANADLYMAALGLGVQVGYILPYGRAQESEADVMGLELMARAGFDPGAGVTLWQNMAKAGGGQGPELLSTHPSNENRIAQLRDLQAQMMPLYQASKGKFSSCQK